MLRSLLLLPATLLAACSDDSARAASARQEAAGGAKFVVRVQPAEGREVTRDALHQAGAILNRRLDPHGALDVAITPQGSDRLEVFVPGMTAEAAKEAREIIEKVARLQFRLLNPEGFLQSGPGVGSVIPVSAEDAEIRPGYVKLRYLDDEEKELPRAQRNKFLWVKIKAELSGKCIKEAYADQFPGAVSFNIHVILHEEYGDRMLKFTQSHIGQPIAICVESTPGEFEVVSAPVVVGAFGAQFQISGRFDEAEARTLASQLTNPLENPVVVEQTNVIRPSVPGSP